MNVVYEVIRQRLTYLLRGNVHGVSANWLSKRVDETYSSIFEISSEPKLKFFIAEDILIEGALVFEDILLSKSGRNYLPNYDCEKGMASFLYASILTLRPKVIVETGIANGISTNIIMKACEKTGGTLHSFDLDSKTANVYDGNGNWKFHLLDGNLKRNFLHEITKLGEIEYWIHDSNHGFAWQSFEYAVATKALSSEGILVSDDIDASTAWGMMDRSSFYFTAGVFDSKKMFGIAQKSINRLS